MRVLAAMVLAWVGGCALGPTLPPLTCPGKGGAPWTALHSPHLLLRTDLPLADARALLEEGERAYDLIEQVLRSDLPEVPPPVDQVHVTVFRHAQDLAALHPHYGGIFYRAQNTPEMTPTLIISGPLDSRARLSLRHELTHRLVGHYLPTAPPWLNEGLAELLSTVKLSGTTAIVGSWDGDLYHHGLQPDVRELFGATSRDFLENGGFYTEASALVHLLQSERRPHRTAFKTFLRHLASGLRADLAWEASFPGLDLDVLERQLNGYRFITLRVDTRAVPVAPRPFAEGGIRAMHDAEVHLLWVELRSWARGASRHEIEKDLEQARQTKEVSAEAHYWTSLFDRVRGRRGPAFAEIEAAVAEKPDEPRYLLVLLGHRRVPAIEERFWKLAHTASQLFFAGVRSYGDRRDEESVRFAEAAIARAPHRSDFWFMLALAWGNLGQWAQAAVAAQRAAWLAPGNASYSRLTVQMAGKARRAGLALPAPPFGQLLPPPRKRHGGLVLRGRIASETGGAVANAYVHLAQAEDHAAALTDANGGFELRLYPGKAELDVLFEDERFLADRWRVSLRPSPKPVDLGTHHVVAGRLPEPMVAFDGMETISIDGQALVDRIDEASPAGLAGIKARDAILSVNGRDVRALGPNAINFYLTGEPGDEVTVVFSPGASEPPRAVVFKLAPLKPQSIR